MSWASYPQTNWQYGHLTPEEARPRQVRRMLAREIDRFLFCGESPAENEAAGLERRIAAFGKALLQDLDSTNEALAALWATLQDAPAAAGDGDWAEEPAARLYCLALYSFFWRLAAGPLAIDDEIDDQAVAPNGDVQASRQDKSNDEGDGDAGRTDVVGSGTRMLWCWAHEWRGDIALALREKFARRSEHNVPADKLQKETTSLAEGLLQVVLKSLPANLQVREKSVKRTSVDGEPRTYRRIEVSSPDLEVRLSEFLRALPYRLTFQPLKEVPAYRRNAGAARDADAVPPQPLLKYGSTNDFLRRFHRTIEADQRYVEAINAQQAVAWRINRDLLQVAVHVAGLALPRECWTTVLEEAVSVAHVGEQEIGAWQRWSAKEFYRPTAGNAARNNYRKPGELLDHPLAKASLEELAWVDSEGRQPLFHLPWRADYRGRIFPRTPWLTPQGADLQRALFEFAEGSRLDDSGVRALKEHGGNLVRRERLLDDLKIAGRKVVKLEERRRWVDMHEESIVASGCSPLKSVFWREASGKPMQFLAFCLAYRRWKEDPSTPCHLPVQIDGTCNGLQHIAALSSNEELAQAVNVVARVDGLPGDIYSDIATVAQASALRARAMAKKPGDGSVSTPNASGRRGGKRPTPLTAARQAVAAVQESALDLLDWPGWIDRDTAKKVVMTVPYGAGPDAQACHVLERIAARLDAAFAGPDGARLWAAAESLGEAVEALEQLAPSDPQTFLRGARRSLKNEVRGNFEKDRPLRKLLKASYRSRAAATAAAPALSAEPSGEAVGVAATSSASAWRLWLGVSALGAYAAQQIVAYLRSSLVCRFPAVRVFEDWLAKVGKCCIGLPLMWVTPLGFPVCQDNFEKKKWSTKDYKFGGCTFNIGGKLLTEEVRNKRKKGKEGTQQSALLPNLIHSLDATHLAKTLNAAVADGIDRFGSIHDCLLCHPNDAGRLGELLRATFADLYAPAASGKGPAVLARWSAWMEIVADIAATDQVSGLLGALQVPDGLAARLLLAARPDSPSLSLLERLRKLDEPHLAMAKLLLEFRRDDGRVGGQGAGEASKTVDSLSPGACFDIGRVRDSLYFFS
jgi:hypothetical protein